MAEAYYPGIAAGDAASVQADGTVVRAVVQANSFSEVFELTDTTFSNPLTVRTPAGLTMTKVPVGDLPIYPDVYVQSPNFAHNWKSGSLVFRRDSEDAKDKAVADALAAGQDLIAALPAEIQKVVDSGDFTGPAGKDGSNVLPTDTAIAQAITTPGSAANTALSDTIASEIVPAVAAAVLPYEKRHPRTIAFLGDSFTDMSVAKNGMNTYRSGRGFITHFMQRSGQRLEIVARPGTTTGGITGQTTEQMLARIQQDVIVLEPGYCHVLAGTNDVGSNFTFATITGNLTAIYNTIQNAGIRLIVATIAPRSGITTAQLQAAENLNNWIRLQSVIRPGVILADYHRDLAGPDGSWRVVGTTAYTADGIHASTGGAMRMGKVLAEALDPIVPKGSGLPTSNVDSLTGVNGIAIPNLAVNPMMTGTAGTLGTSGATGQVADGYVVTTYAGGGVTTGMALSKVARTDGPAGDWQQVVSTSSTAKLRIQQSLSTNANLAAGDELYAMVEYEVENLSAMNMFRIQAATFDANNGYANQGTVIDFDIGADDIPTYPYALHPVKGILRTPPLVYPATATGLSLTFDLSFVGTVRFGRFTLRRKR